MKLKLFLESKGGRIVYWSVLLLLAAVFLFSGLMIALYYLDGHQSQVQYQELAQMVQVDADRPDEKPPTAAEKYAPLLEQNEDFIGWIHIDGTRIDYPVVQRQDAKNYYLRRGFDKKYSYYGVPFAFEDATFGEADNFVIYGHHMDNGSMFSDLMKYTSPVFYQEHPQIQLDTMEGYGTYEIIAVLKTVAGGENEFHYYKFSKAASAEEFDTYVAECKARSLYNIDTTAKYGDKLITLSTCEYSKENGRLAIVAKKVNR